MLSIPCLLSTSKLRQQATSAAATQQQTCQMQKPRSERWRQTQPGATAGCESCLELLLPCQQDVLLTASQLPQYDVVLGRGAFKTVFKAFDEAEGLEVAWNQVKVNDLANSPAERERLFAEIRVLKQLKHKNIMTFYDSWLDQKNLTINFITELFTSGTLRQ